MADNRQMVYVGTYTHEAEPHRRDSIYVYELDARSGKLEFRRTIDDVANPSYMVFAKSGSVLLAANELGEFGGTIGGGISAFTLQPASGEAVLINSQPTQGAHPCYVTIDATGKWALVANYSGGSVTVFPVGDDGKLGAAADHVQHQGSSVNADRQEKAHAHSLIFDPQQRYALVADLGMDKIVIYRFDASSGKLTSHAETSMTPGAGPRHQVFHPNGHRYYVSLELDSTIGVYDWNAEAGTLAQRQTIASIPADFTAETTGAELQVSRDGRFLYASNRGHDSIAVFAIDDQGALTLLETVSTGGKRPRNFTLDLTGNFLLVANQDTDSLVVFRIDQLTGKLTQTDSAVTLPTPVVVKVIALE